MLYVHPLRPPCVEHQLITQPLTSLPKAPHPVPGASQQRLGLGIQEQLVVQAFRRLVTQAVPEAQGVRQPPCRPTCRRCSHLAATLIREYAERVFVIFPQGFCFWVSNA